MAEKYGLYYRTDTIERSVSRPCEPKRFFWLGLPDVSNTGFCREKLALSNGIKFEHLPSRYGWKNSEILKNSKKNTFPQKSDSTHWCVLLSSARRRPFKLRIWICPFLIMLFVSTMKREVTIGPSRTTSENARYSHGSSLRTAMRPLWHTGTVFVEVEVPDCMWNTVYKNNVHAMMT